MTENKATKEILRIKNLTKIYAGDKTAVDSLNLSVQAGDIYGFIGHNGAGKTTTIRAVAGVMEFDKGEILVNGYSVSQEAMKCKSIMAFIPDNPDLYEYLTGIQYLNYISDIFRVSGEMREKRIGKYSELMGMTKSLGDLISSYSHGMKQKLAIIAAFLHNPKLLILDEPFVGLDPEAAFHLKTMMNELCMEGGAIFFSTHVLDVAEKLCNKIAIIKNGKLIASGETKAVRGDSSLEEIFLEVTGNDQV